MDRRRGHGYGTLLCLTSPITVLRRNTGTHSQGVFFPTRSRLMLRIAVSEILYITPGLSLLGNQLFRSQVPGDSELYYTSMLAFTTLTPSAEVSSSSSSRGFPPSDSPNSRNNSRQPLQSTPSRLSQPPTIANSKAAHLPEGCGAASTSRGSIEATR